MSDLEASIDFSIELGAFYNVDLFQRGHYQLRVGLKTFNSKTPLKVTCHPPKSAVKVNLDRKPAHIIQGVAVSQSFKILYKEEDVTLDDVFTFTVHMLVDCNKLEESIEKSGLKLIVELWFAEELSDNVDTFEVACSRVYDITFAPSLGLHLHIPVMFDYFHLSAVCMTVHASLIAIHQPIYNPKNPSSSWPLRNGNMSTLESVLYGAHVPVHAYVHIKKPALRSANYMFRVMCKLLLSAYESLQNEVKRVVKRLSNKVSFKEPEYKDCHLELDKLCKEVETVKSDEEFVLHATSKIAHLCAYNVVLWQTLTEAFGSDLRIKKILAKEYHQQRVKRFSEAFFTQEWQKKDILNIYEPSINGHVDLAAMVRGSAYFMNPSGMPLLSIDVDGNHTNLPIIFEDVYKDETAAPIILASSSQELSAEDGDEGFSSATSVQEKTLNPRKSVMIKNVLPSIVTRPGRSYSITEDLAKNGESQPENVSDAQLLGFKRLSTDISDEHYGIGSLSPTEKRFSLKRKESLLLPSGEKRRSKSNEDTEVTSYYLSSDDLSVSPDDKASQLSPQSSELKVKPISLKEVNLSPKSEKSFKLNKTSTKQLGSPKPLKQKIQTPRPLSVIPLDVQSKNSGIMADIIPSTHLLPPASKNMTVSKSEPKITNAAGQVLVQPITDRVIDFLTSKEDLKAKLSYHGHLYSDFANLASDMPYFWHSIRGSNNLHLVICVHGLDGNSRDLRLVKHYMELSLPGERLEFLMSEVNTDTFLDFQTMGEKLANEILHYIDIHYLEPTKISFIAHSLGNIIVRAALTIPKLLNVIESKLYTYLSLSGPHLGMLYSDSTLVNMAMWVMQKWKKSGSLVQLNMKDSSDLRSTFIFKLSQQPGLEYFKNILLVSSIQDKYMPYHSSRIELCKSAQRDNSQMGQCYAEMVRNLLDPLLKKPNTTLVRYDVFYTLPTNTNSMIGRAAHIAALDSELFIEKFFLVSACKYFK